MLRSVSLRFDLANGYDSVWSFSDFVLKKWHNPPIFWEWPWFPRNTTDGFDLLHEFAILAQCPIWDALLKSSIPNDKKPSSHPQILSTSRSPAARRTKHRIRSFAIDEVLLPLSSFPCFEILLLWVMDKTSMPPLVEDILWSKFWRLFSCHLRRYTIICGVFSLFRKIGSIFRLDAF